MTIFTGTPGDDIHFAHDSHMYGRGGDDNLWVTGSGSEPGGFLYGGAGNDTLRGSNGDDAIYGGRGADVIRPAFGRDVIHGGKGHDTFEFTFANVVGADGPVSIGMNYILDFKPGRDTIAVASMGFPEPELIYRKKKGVVAVDFDGDNGMKPVKFVKIDKHLDLKDGDLIAI